MMVLFIVLAFVRLTLFVLMVVSAAQLIRDLGRERRRWPTNPSVRGGLILIASSGAGLTFLLCRLLLSQARHGWPLFRVTSGSVLGEVVAALCALAAVGGVLLLIRGIRGLVFPGKSGALPPILRPISHPAHDALDAPPPAREKKGPQP